MFALVVSIMALALTVAVIFFGNFYGGSALTGAEVQAEVTRIKNEEQQILAAADFFNADHGRFPHDVSELVQGKYLLSVPKGATAVASADPISLMSRAYAAEPAKGWGQPHAGHPTFMTEATVPKEVCRKYNQVTRGDDGILKQVFENLAGQCYGVNDTYRVLATKRTSLALAQVLAPIPVVAGGLPGKGSGSAFWDTEPSAEPTAPVDPEKVPQAKLAWQSTTAEDFGDVQVGQTVAGASHTITNTGNLRADSLTIYITGPFTRANSTCPESLAPGASCTVAVAFKPLAAGNYEGSVALISGNAGAPALVVKGTGVAAAPSATLSGAIFGDVAAGATVDRAVTLSNTGTSSLSVTVPTAANIAGADFNFLDTTCTPWLAAGQECTVSLRYTAKGAAAAVGTLTVDTGAGALVANLSGNSLQAILEVSVSSISFGEVQIGESKHSGWFKLVNTGNSELTGLEFSAHPGFGVSHICSSGRLAPGAECQAAISFNPYTAKLTTIGFTISTQNGGSPIIAVSGTGVLPSATLSNISFGSVTAGATADLVSTLSNTGIGPLAVTVPTSASVTGAGFSFAGTTCGPSLAVDETCSTTVRYSAAGQADATGALTIGTSSGSKTASLTGNSQPAFTLSAASSAFGSVQVGQSSAYTVHTLTNNGNVAVTGLSISAPAGFSIGSPLASSPCEARLEAHSICYFSITFKPTAAQAYNANVSIGSANGGSGSVNVTGTGTSPVVALNPGMFAVSAINGYNDDFNVRITNNSGQNLTVTSVTFSGSYDEYVYAVIGGVQFGYTYNQYEWCCTFGGNAAWYAGAAATVYYDIQGGYTSMSVTFSNGQTVALYIPLAN